MKAEKNELRYEKQRLRDTNEKLEQQVKATSSARRMFDEMPILEFK